MNTSEHTRDLYLRRHYNLTLEEYNEMMAEQGSVCALCGHPPKSRSLSVDHCHRYVKQAIHSQKVDSGLWKAWTETMWEYGHSHGDAVQKIRRRMLRKSIRGLLCYRCNKGIAFYRDDPKLFRRVAEYLERFNENS